MSPDLNKQLVIDSAISTFMSAGREVSIDSRLDFPAAKMFVSAVANAAIQK